MTLTEEIYTYLKEVTDSSDLNRFPEQYGGGYCFSEPFFGVSHSDDPLFEELKTVIASDHPTPVEVWRKNDLPDEGDLASGLRVLSMVFPYSREVRESGSRHTGELPETLYTIARNYSEAFVNMIMQRSVDWFTDKGFSALAPRLMPDYGYIKKEQPFELYSNWSERHVAFVAGLGYFGFNSSFITKQGCNVIIASVVTDAPLAVTPRTVEKPVNCLYFTTGKCKQCVTRCPSDGLVEAGFQMEACLNHCKKVRAILADSPITQVLKKRYRTFKLEDRMEVTYPVGCTFCQFGVPCTDRDPLKIL